MVCGHWDVLHCTGGTDEQECDTTGCELASPLGKQSPLVPGRSRDIKAATVCERSAGELVTCVYLH